MSIQCSVCLEKLDFSNDHISVTKCGHIFHKRCLSRWTRQNLNCPECRKKVHWRNTVKRLFANIDETEQDSSRTTSLQELQNLNSDLQLQLSDSLKQVCVLKQKVNDQH